MGNGKGLGKLIFFGEHAAVHGYPALGASLPWKITVEHEPTEEEVWEFPSLPSAYRLPLLDALKSFEDTLGQRAKRGILRLKSEIPVGAGFGSSGALCGALVQALNPGTFRENWKTAHEMEKNFHGKPSGIDTALALKEGITAFFPQEKGLPEMKTLPGFPLHLVVGALPRLGSTKELVLGITEKVTAQDSETLNALKKLGNLSMEAINSLEGAKANSQLWGVLATKAQTVLASLGLSTPDMDKVLARGEVSGALGGKLSGAGGGGAFFLLYPDSTTAQEGKKDLTTWAQSQNLTWAAPPEALRWDSDHSRLALGRSAFDSLFGN